MDKKEKKELSESDICDLFITPALKHAGWDSYKQIRREVTLTPGPVIVRGEMSARNKKKNTENVSSQFDMLIEVKTPPPTILRRYM